MRRKPINGEETAITAESLEAALGDLVKCPICGQGIVFEKQASWYQPYFDEAYFQYLVLTYQLRAAEIMALSDENKKLGAHIISCKIKMTVKMLEKLLDDPAGLKARYEQDVAERMADHWARREEFAADFLEMPFRLDHQVKPGEELGSLRRYTRTQIKRLKEWVGLLKAEEDAEVNQ